MKYLPLVVPKKNGAEKKKSCQKEKVMPQKKKSCQKEKVVPKKKSRPKKKGRAEKKSRARENWKRNLMRKIRWH